MAQGPKLLSEWVNDKGSGAIVFEPKHGVYRWDFGVSVLRSYNHDPIDSDSFVIAEIRMGCDCSGELIMDWECVGGARGGPMKSAIQVERQTTIRFPVYARPRLDGEDSVYANPVSKKNV